MGLIMMKSGKELAAVVSMTELTKSHIATATDLVRVPTETEIRRGIVVVVIETEDIAMSGETVTEIVVTGIGTEIAPNATINVEKENQMICWSFAIKRNARRGKNPHSPVT